MSAYLIAQIGKNFSENEGKLLSFYRNNRFSQFDTRQTTSNTDKPHELVQLLRLL